MKLAIEVTAGVSSGLDPETLVRVSKQPHGWTDRCGGRGHRGARRRLMADHAAEPLEAVLRRLKVERDQADARYNAALTAVDRAIHQAAPIPQPPSTLDDHQIAAINDAWNILPRHPQGRVCAEGGRIHLASHRPVLQRQLTFNSLLVDHSIAMPRGPRGAPHGWKSPLTRFGSTGGARAVRGAPAAYLQQITDMSTRRIATPPVPHSSSTRRSAVSRTASPSGGIHAGAGAARPHPGRRADRGTG
jgi:hypothetical protein